MSNDKSFLSRAQMNPPGLPRGEADSDNATRYVPEPEVLVPFTKTTARAFAASIAFVVAGATLAGAAVFHVPVLGFSSAAASSTPTPVRKVLAIHKVAPRKIVRVRYVDEVVHRPAPVSTYSAAPVAVSYQAPAAPPVAPVVAAPVTPTPRTARATYHEDSQPEREAGDHAPPGVHGSTSATATVNGAD
jgi:hypothetical protein